MNIIISITVFLIVIVIHELAHGYTAYRLGDDTADKAGRLTLNPVAHIDPVGTVLLPALLIYSGSPVIFGWAKPVPIDMSKFRDPVKGMLMTGAAGPLSNLALAVLFALPVRAGLAPTGSILGAFCLTGVVISLVLGVFNLIPVPPLDGSHVLMAVLPRRIRYYYAKAERFGFIILIALLYMGLIDRVILPIVAVLTRFVLG
ncbi:MAG: site-2 protease family protein [Candidatus Omnitrophica bacterium]|nr:site-2 protease family protein [Candidatus Omnitrophota bacterium]